MSKTNCGNLHRSAEQHHLISTRLLPHLHHFLHRALHRHSLIHAAAGARPLVEAVCVATELIRARAGLSVFYLSFSPHSLHIRSTRSATNLRPLVSSPLLARRLHLASWTAIFAIPATRGAAPRRGTYVTAPHHGISSQPHRENHDNLGQRSAAMKRQRLQPALGAPEVTLVLCPFSHCAPLPVNRRHCALPTCQRLFPTSSTISITIGVRRVRPSSHPDLELNEIDDSF